MFLTTSASRRNRSVLSTKWVKLSPKISHFFGPDTWPINSSGHNARFSSCWLSQLTSQESSESDLPLHLFAKNFSLRFFCSLYSYGTDLPLFENGKKSLKCLCIEIFDNFLLANMKDR